MPKPATAEEQAVVAVANRLPVRHGDDGWELSPGGLVTALRPVMTSHEGAWVGWDGGSKGIPATLPGAGTRLLPIRRRIPISAIPHAEPAPGPGRSCTLR